METANIFCTSQVDRQPRLQSHHHPQLSPFNRSHNLQSLPLSHPQLPPHHHQQPGRKQLFRPASDESRAARATSDGGPGTTRAEAAPAPPVPQPTSLTDSWRRSQQLPASTGIYTPPSPAPRKQQPTLLHHQHRHALSHARTASLHHPPSPLSSRGSPTIPFLDTAYRRQTISNVHGTISTAAMDAPASTPPSTVPTVSSSPGESANSANSALSGHPDQEARLQESSDRTSSPPSTGVSTGSDSDSLPTSPPGQVTVPVTDNTQAAPTTSFRFPGSRRNSSGSSSNRSLVQQPQVTQAAVQPAVELATAPSTPAAFSAYCLDRGNGLYTRLVPADMLPPSAGYTPLQSDSWGMIVLQDPATQPMAGVSSLLSPVGVGAGANLPSFGSRLSQQPNFAAYPAAQATALTQRPGSAMPNVSNAKKNKVYCDKWVHEGICAFTQQGCKFKHEMPHDRSIQRALGLFHGYPNWYKKLQAHESQQTAAADTAATTLPTPAHLLALPAPPGIEKQQQRQQQMPQPSFLAHTAAFAPGLVSSVHSGLSCPMPVAAAPPSTPLQQQAGLYQPAYYPAFGGPVAGGRLRGSSGSSIDGPWRTTGVNAPSWRTQQPSTVADTSSGPLPDSSTAHLTESFFRSLGINEPLGSVYHNVQQQSAPLSVPVTVPATGPATVPVAMAANTVSPFAMGMASVTGTYPIGFGLGFARGRGGSLGAVDGTDTADHMFVGAGSGGGNTGRSAFGPIEPPSRTTQETGLPNAFSFRGSQPGEE